MKPVINLTSNIRQAKWGKHWLFPHPLYNKEKKEEYMTYLLFDFINENGNRVLKSYWTLMPMYNFSKVDFPSYYIAFYKTTKGYWLVSFNAENIIASRYFKMEDEEVQKILKRKIDY